MKVIIINTIIIAVAATLSISFFFFFAMLGFKASVSCVSETHHLEKTMSSETTSVGNWRAVQ